MNPHELNPGVGVWRKADQETRLEGRADETERKRDASRRESVCVKRGREAINTCC